MTVSATQQTRVRSSACGAEWRPTASTTCLLCRCEPEDREARRRRGGDGSGRQEGACRSRRSGAPSQRARRMLKEQHRRKDSQRTHGEVARCPDLVIGAESFAGSKIFYRTYCTLVECGLPLIPNKKMCTFSTCSREKGNEQTAGGLCAPGQVNSPAPPAPPLPLHQTAVWASVCAAAAAERCDQRCRRERGSSWRGGIGSGCGQGEDRGPAGVVHELPA